MLLRYKRPRPKYPPYLEDKFDENGKNSKGYGGFVRGACLVRIKLQQPELDFIKAALPHLPVHEGMCKPRPPANCITQEQVDQMRTLLRKKIAPFPWCVDMHLKNACFACGVQGHVSRFCTEIYAGAEAMDYDLVSDAVKGQAKREREACKAAFDNENKKTKRTKSNCEERAKVREQETVRDAEFGRCDFLPGVSRGGPREGGAMQNLQQVAAQQVETRWCLHKEVRQTAVQAVQLHYT